MKVHERNASGVLILAPQGKITSDHGALDLTRAVEAALKNGSRNLVMDFTGVLYLDSSGLGELVKCYSILAAAGGALRLFGVNYRVFCLLQMTKFDTVVKILDTEAEALAGLQGWGG